MLAADNWSLYDYIVLALVLCAFACGMWLLWLGRKWDRKDVLPPPRRNTRRPGRVPEYPRQRYF